jgi:2-dehydro-3-deoxyphosphooctonate aldolase (KDO 8-P synthase)
LARAPSLIAGPGVVEPGDVLPRAAAALADRGQRLGIPAGYMASFDTANRSRRDAPRGPGLEEGLRLLQDAGRGAGLPILTDVHEAAQVAAVADAVDVLQIPAFLCRQTDLLLAAGATGLPVNIKKGQWMQPEGMVGAVEKVRGAGATEVAVTERGTFFGYGDLVVDMRSFARLKAATGVPAIHDATHSVQQPGQGEGGSSGGLRQFIPPLLAAAAAAGADGFFLEAHPDPAHAPSDAATQWPLDRLHDLMAATLDVWAASRRGITG